MGAGIAVPMQKTFGLRGKIINTNIKLKHPIVILTGRVFNLITKAKSSGKPTLRSLHMTITQMRDVALLNGIKRIAMPKIGCGLDRLQWGEVREIIKKEFEFTDIEILVCVWE
jgi:O-acetyl-ADP-ribose deacetylase (regulator of RNase III)